MSELAFDEDGQHFEVPATVGRWRVRRFNNPGRPGGAQVVYGDDGLPLFLDVETSAEEFRRKIPGAQVELIPNCGHIPQLERPAYTRRRVRDFIEKLKT